MADKILSPLDNFGSKDCLLARKLCQKNRDAYVDDQNWQQIRPTSLTGL